MTNSLRDLHVKNDDVMHSQRGGREDKAILSHYFSGTITLWSIASFINRKQVKRHDGTLLDSHALHSAASPLKYLHVF